MGPVHRLPPRSRDHRGQTAFDFLVGMSLFLLTVGVVFNFVPGMFRPFDTGTGPDMVTADRSAAQLAEDLLVEDVDAPGVLNETCTAEFFDGNVPPECRFTASADDLHDALGVRTSTGLNVSIEADGSLRNVQGVDMAAGPAPPPNRDVVSAQRVVHVDGEQSRLKVRVW